MSEMENSAEFERIAARTRQGLNEMMEALSSELGDSQPAEALTAMMTGAVAQAVQFYFGGCVLAGVGFAAGRDGLDRLVDDYWKQSVTGHFTAQAREAVKAGKKGRRRGE